MLFTMFVISFFLSRPNFLGLRSNHILEILPQDADGWVYSSAMPLSSCPWEILWGKTIYFGIFRIYNQFTYKMRWRDVKNSKKKLVHQQCLLCMRLLLF